jgi:sulfur-carrier protein
LAVTVKIPHIFSHLINGKKEILVKPGSLADIFKEIKETYPELSKALLDEKDFIKGFITLILDKKFIDKISQKNLYIEDNQSLNIIIQMSGG